MTERYCTSQPREKKTPQVYYGHCGSRRLQWTEEPAGHAGDVWTRMHGGLTMLRVQREGIGYPDCGLSSASPGQLLTSRRRGEQSNK
jgi:hypothetical protein